MPLNALLILSFSALKLPSRIRSSLTSVLKKDFVHSNGTLYVQIWRPPPNVHCPSLPHPFWTNPSLWSQAARTVYSHATSSCPHADVRFIVKNSVVSAHLSPLPLQTTKIIDFVFVDHELRNIEKEIRDFVGNDIRNKIGDVEVKFLAEQKLDETDRLDGTEPLDCKVFDTVALGGTFDRIHNGHKILLVESVLRCRKELIVGVTDESMIKNKLLSYLVEPCEVRLGKVLEFLEDTSPELKFRVVPISDPFGPTITEANIEAIVVSQETIRGAEKINEIRSQKGYPPLAVHSIELVAESCKESELEEDKVSSSSKRLRILGERLRPALKDPSLPYIIGLTGGICSGKTTIAQYINENLKIPSINCDLLGHEAYKPGTECFKKIVEAFGEEILNEGKTEINRKALGGKVFGKPEELKRLTDIVWPEIKRLAGERIRDLVKEGHKVIVLDAAVLLEAGWDDICHEIWVAFVPREEAMKRIQGRDKLSKEDAEKRIDSQVSIQERLCKATFAFCSHWEMEFTRKQVDKAWAQVKSVIESISN